MEKVSNKEDFLSMIETMKYPKILYLKNISFIELMNLDYFFLRNFEGIGNGIVSENLKIEIEKQGITGIEFKPIEISLNDWFGSNGLREKIYGRVSNRRVGV